MSRTSRTISLIVGALLVLATVGTGIAVARGAVDLRTAAHGEADDHESADTGEVLSPARARQAAQAALAATGGGTVVGTEQGDNPGSSYEVEVRTSDGAIIEVLLSADLAVLDHVEGEAD